jgi:hypothetical protein
MERKPNEEFTQIENSDYSVNELGVVKNLKTGNIINPFLISQYPAVNITIDGKRKTSYVHHLMALVFLDYVAKRGLMSINHIDANKQNNRLDNLEVITHRRNSALTFVHKKRKLPTGVVENPIGVRKFKAQISYLGINRYLGAYMTAEEASQVYQDASDAIVKTGHLPEHFLNRKKYDRYKRED